MQHQVLSFISLSRNTDLVVRLVYYNFNIIKLNSLIASSLIAMAGS